MTSCPRKSLTYLANLSLFLAGFANDCRLWLELCHNIPTNSALSLSILWASDNTSLPQPLKGQGASSPWGNSSLFHFTFLLKVAIVFNCCSCNNAISSSSPVTITCATGSCKNSNSEGIWCPVWTNHFYSASACGFSCNWSCLVICSLPFSFSPATFHTGSTCSASLHDSSCWYSCGNLCSTWCSYCTVCLLSSLFTGDWYLLDCYQLSSWCHAPHLWYWGHHCFLWH